MRVFHILFSVMCLIVTHTMQCHAQTLIAERHLPYTVDSLFAYKLPYIAITDSGQNCVWNFAAIPMDSAEYIDINYFAPVTDTAYIGLHREHANYYYLYRRDTLWMTGYETSHVHVRYSSQIPYLRFPFTYGDSIHTAFAGDGRYCHILSFSVEGERQVNADAVGQLFLPDMVVDSVLRVHSRNRYRANIHPQSDVDEERYLWFSPYGHYPLFETVRIQTISGQDTVLFASSYYLPTDEDLSLPLKALEDTLSEPVDSLITDVRYMPNPVCSDLQVQYTLTKSAQVYISVHYNGGISIYQTPFRREEEGAHSVSIPMGGMPIGNYVVYIHAENSVVAGDIIKL